MAGDRRDVRYPARIVARVIRRNKPVELLTNDVSFRGVFVRTDSPPALRQLVKFELLLPERTIVSGHAMVVHVTRLPEGQPKGEGPVPGIGLQFWGQIEHGREWEAFIHDLRQRQRLGTATAKVLDRVRRASERFKVALEVSLDGETMMTRDISENGARIRTDMPLPVGLRAEITLRGQDQVLKFDGIVRRAIDEPDFRGLGVEFVDMTPEQRQELARFIRANAPSEDRVFIPPGDPKLH